MYNGWSFDPKGRQKGLWQSTSVKIDLAQNRLWFFCRDCLTRGDPKDDDYLGSGYVAFEANHTGRFTSGNGVFVDAGTELAIGKTELVRIEENQVKKFLGKPFIQDGKDRADFIKAYKRENEGVR
jgi:hypothetical protein